MIKKKLLKVLMVLMGLGIVISWGIYRIEMGILEGYVLQFHALKELFVTHNSFFEIAGNKDINLALDLNMEVLNVAS
jgi:hypothetical protein